MNTIDELKAEVEYQLEQALAIDWSSPKAYNPLTVAMTFQMAAFKLMMKPENQLVMWRSLMDPRNYRIGGDK
jgi:hypothetical protein